MTNTFLLKAINDLEFEDIKVIELTKEDKLLLEGAKNKTMCNIFREQSKAMAEKELNEGECIQEELQIYDIATAEAAAAGGAGMKFFATSHDFGVRHLIYKTNERLLIVFSSFLYKPLRLRCISLNQLDSLELHQFAGQVKIIFNTKNHENYEVQVSETEALEVKSFLKEIKVKEATFDYIENKEVKETVSQLVDVNRIYYDAKWKKYEKNKYFKGFNLFGLLMNGYWALYRKLYFEALLIILMPLLVGMYDKKVALILAFAGAFFLGMFGNSIYYYRILKRARAGKVNILNKGVYAQLPYLFTILLTIVFILSIMLPKLLKLI